MLKDHEYLKDKASYCLDLAKKLGATSASVSVVHSISESVSFRNKILDESNRSDNLGVSITTYIDKKKSSISSSNLLDENIKTLIEKCVETAKITRKHNNSNVICLKGRPFVKKNIFAMLDAYFSTDFEEGRHKRRVRQLWHWTHNFFQVI